MRIALATLATLSLVACSKPAQPTADASQSANPPPPATDTTPAPTAQADASNSGNAAMKDTHQETSGPPAAGANSFTEAQAKEHLRNAGYTDVTGLTQDSSGVWHGSASKGGQTMTVSVDYKGTISTQ